MFAVELLLTNRNLEHDKEVGVTGLIFNNMSHFINLSHVN